MRLSKNNNGKLNGEEKPRENETEERNSTQQQPTENSVRFISL